MATVRRKKAFVRRRRVSFARSRALEWLPGSSSPIGLA